MCDEMWKLGKDSAAVGWIDRSADTCTSIQPTCAELVDVNRTDGMHKAVDPPR